MSDEESMIALFDAAVRLRTGVYLFAKDYPSAPATFVAWAATKSIPVTHSNVTVNVLYARTKSHHEIVVYL